MKWSVITTRFNGKLSNLAPDMPTPRGKTHCCQSEPDPSHVCLVTSLDDYFEIRHRSQQHIDVNLT